MSKAGGGSGPGRRSERVRLALVAGAVLLVFAGAMARAVHLQIVEGPSLRDRARRQHTRKIEIQPARGVIYDRHERVLARTLPGWSVFADPAVLLASPQVLPKLCRALGLPRDQVRRSLKRGGRRFAWIKRGITPREERAVRDLGLPGVGLVQEPQRFYPKRSLAGQILGFVGVDGRGLGGLEHRYDDFLRGRPRWVLARRDARGRLLLPDAPDPTQGRGGALVLTLDETIQHIAEEELGRAVEQSRARGGVAVVLDPSTGEVLAIAQVPLFNPNALRGSSAADRKPRAVADVFEPGSTLKAPFVGILMERGLARPGDRVFCENGAWAVNGRTIHDHKPHGWLTVAEVLRVSSNIGVAKLSERIAPEALYSGLRAFGFGEPTGIEIPGESRGLLPAPRAWSRITPKTLAYGQGIGATALQVAAAFAAIANGGMRMAPRLVREMRDPQGRVVRRFEPVPAGRALSPGTARVLTGLLERVVDPEGTAPKAAVPGYRVAGKTGTAWKVDPVRGGYDPKRVVASFVGYVPARRPRVAILVAVDEPRKGPRYGGLVAAPAFREIARQVLAYLGVPPDEAVADDEPATPVPPARDVARRAAEPGTMPALAGMTMREVLRALQASGAGVRVQLLGTGWASGQEPPPGTRLDPGQTCSVVFRPAR